MSDAETRSIRQCTYVPLRNDLPTAGSDAAPFAGSVAEQSLMKQAIAERPLMKLAAARAVFPDANMRAAVVDRKTFLRVAGARRILDAIEADERGDTAAAFSIIAAVPADTVQRFTTAAITGQSNLLAMALVQLNVAWQKQQPAPGKAAKEQASPFVNAFNSLPEAERQHLLGVLPRAMLQPPLVLAKIGEETMGVRVPTPKALERTVATQLTVRVNLIRELLRLARIQPAGLLHLERMDMTPVGTEAGDLAYSITLLPGETVRLTHRDWSRTENEFVRIVESSIERATEDALTEKTELTDATQTQRQHSQNMSASVSASGGFGFMSISAAAALNITDSDSQSRSTTVQRSRDATSKASSRVKQEQKTSFRVDATFEVENTSFRELRNDGPEPVRWDFHRVLREWRVRLFRYGLRLTYDLVIPEPGSYLLRRYFELDRIEKELLHGTAEQPPQIGEISETSWQDLSRQHGVVLDPPPQPKELSVSAEIAFNNVKSGSGFLELDAGDGYQIEWLNAQTEPAYENPTSEKDGTQVGVIDDANRENQNLLETRPTRFGWRYRYRWFGNAAAGQIMTIRVAGQARPSPTRIEQWRGEMFNRLTEAFRQRHDEKVQQLTRERDALLRDLSAYDVLSLRRIEREEIMKGVLRWLLGPSFRFTPDLSEELQTEPAAENGDLALYTDEGAVRADSYQAVLRHASLIRFLHHAVEWEAVNFILYPYFWADLKRWDLKQRLTHTDDMHWNFLRAGAARVVLTIRPGFERDFLSLMERFDPAALPSSHPYVALADEVRDRARKYDPDDRDADPELQKPLATWTEYTPTNAFDVRRASAAGSP